jgi:tetratricopeptide (TPR) repeat protein
MRLLIAIAAAGLFSSGALASDTVEPAVEKHMNVTPELLSARAETALAEGRLVEARLLLDRLARPGTEQVDIAAPLELRYALASDNLAKAQELMNEAPALSSQDCRWRVARGMYHEARGEAESAILELGPAASECPLDASAWRALGQALAADGEEMASIYAFDRAVEHAPSATSIRIAYARMLMSFKRHDMARRQLDLVLQIDPLDSDARLMRDLLAGLSGEDIVRLETDTDKLWAARLATVARGARQAGDAERSRALAARAVMASPDFDADLFAQASAP